MFAPTNNTAISAAIGTVISTASGALIGLIINRRIWCHHGVVQWCSCNHILKYTHDQMITFTGSSGFAIVFTNTVSFSIILVFAHSSVIISS
jgi:hypothetical protein